MLAQSDRCYLEPPVADQQFDTQAVSDIIFGSHKNNRPHSTVNMTLKFMNRESLRTKHYTPFI